VKGVSRLMLAGLACSLGEGGLCMGDDALVLRCTDGLGEFERLHASKWMKAFFGCCAQRSHAGFYRFVGLYGAALLLGE